ERIHHNGLATSSLAGENVQPRVKADADLFHDGIVFDVEFKQHCSLSYPVWENVRIHRDDHAEHGSEQDAVPEREAEQLRFILRFHAGGRGCDGDALETDHFAHDAAARVRCSHQERIESELIRGDNLQVAEERV